MAESVIKNEYPYSNVMTFANEWVLGFVTSGNNTHILLPVPYPYKSISSSTIGVRVYDASIGWMDCNLRDHTITHQGIDIMVDFTSMASNYGKVMLFELNGTIVLA